VPEPALLPPTAGQHQIVTVTNFGVVQSLSSLAQQRYVLAPQNPRDETTNYIRDLLVEHEVLPSRDEALARFQSWSVTAQQRITTDDAQFIRWRLEKRLRTMNPVTESAFLRAKQTVTVTIDFCNWLAAERSTTINELTQTYHRRHRDDRPRRPPDRTSAAARRALRAIATSNHNNQTATHRNSRWVFRGTAPGRHIVAAHLRERLRPTLASLEALLGTLTELTRTTPIAILAETLGYSPHTLEAHARVSGATYARYIATRLDS
jgi:hypothetical protein